MARSGSRPEPPSGTPDDRFEIVNTDNGIELLQGDAVLSRLSPRPGPTHGIFDLIAAALAAQHTGGDLLMLGFAAGGVVAPLRAMGFDAAIHGVDLSLEGLEVFGRCSDSWCGQVEVHQADAEAWLSSTSHTFGLVLEDLSILDTGGVTKPPISRTTIPALVAQHLEPGGTAVFNLLTTPGITWQEQVERSAAPFASALVVRDRSYENRLLVCSSRLPAAGILVRNLHQILHRIGSRRAGQAAVRSIRSITSAATERAS